MIKNMNININISIRNGTLSSKLGDPKLLKALDIIPDLNMDFSALVEAHMVKNDEDAYWPENLSLFTINCEHY